MKKALIAYFSWSNISNKIARMLFEKIESDIIQIEPVKKYSNSYSATVIKSGVEKLKKSRPKLVNKIKNIGMYEIIDLLISV